MRHSRPAALVTAASLAGYLLLATGAAGARTWDVPLVAPTIQAGIDSAAVGDTVLVACGTYLEHDIVMKGGVTLRGASGDPACVVIDAQQLGRVIDCNLVSQRANIEGLTLTGGRTPDGWLEALGGGIRCQSSSLRVADCVITGNQARIGGGLGIEKSSIEIVDCALSGNQATHYNWAAGGAVWCRESSGTFARCSVTGNSAFSTPVASPGDGGGFFCNKTQIVVTDCTFDGNATGAGAGAVYSLNYDAMALRRCVFVDNSANWGGAMYFEFDSRATADSCTFRDNAALSGGALLIDSSSTPIFQDCLFAGNRATAGAGGAIQAWVSTPTLRRCRFEANSSTSDGGALFGGGAAPFVEECVFLDNTAAVRGGAVHFQGAGATLSRCTLVRNAAPAGSALSLVSGSSVALTRGIVAFAPQGAPVAADGSSFVTLSCTDVYGNVDGDWVGPLAGQLGSAGNIAADPCFCSLATGDLRLSGDSWCLAGLHPEACGQSMGALGVGCPPSDCAGAVPALVAAFDARPAGGAVTVRLRLGEGAGAPALRLVARAAGTEWEIPLAADGDLLVGTDARGYGLLAGGGAAEVAYVLLLWRDGDWAEAARQAVAAADVPGLAGLELSASPNPFNPATTIRFALPRAGSASLTIYTASGRKVVELWRGELLAGAHEARWDGRDADGRAAASGTYFCRLESVAGQRTERMALIR